MKLKIVKINSKYCDFLRQFDSKVVFNYGNKENRPYVGVLFKINNVEYFAPLSSPKIKHLKMSNNSLDYMKINKGELGIVNFNNMIPLISKVYDEIDLNTIKKETNEEKYRLLLKKQYEFLFDNILELKSKAKKLYYLYCHNYLDEKIQNRCCNFKLLEEKCIEYNKI